MADTWFANYADSYPDLRLDCVLGSSKERFDSQVLFDPFEEQFDLPAAFVKQCNCQCVQRKVVC